MNWKGFFGNETAAPNSIKLLLESPFKWLLMCLIVAIMGGVTAAIFLMALEWVTHFRQANPWLLYCLPLVGLLTVFLYEKCPTPIKRGNNLVIEAAQQHEKPNIPWQMAPAVLLGTLLSHLGGASVGREGTAVQMSGSLADRLTHPFNLTQNERTVVIKGAIAAGFAGVFGTPIAAIFFAMEVVRFRNFHWRGWWFIVLAAVGSHMVVGFFPVHHTHYFAGAMPKANERLFAALVVLGLLSAFSASLFSLLLQHGNRLLAARFSNPYWKIAIGACCLLPVLLWVGPAFQGLGIEGIASAFQQPTPPFTGIIKLLLTASCILIGFKGGEVTPLFFIGAALGSTIAPILGMPVGFMAALGFVAVFCGATNTLMASVFMGMELFGWPMVGYLVIVCGLSYFLSARSTIYEAQFL